MTFGAIALVVLGVVGTVAIARFLWSAIREGAQEGLAEARANIAEARSREAEVDSALMAEARADLASLVADAPGARMGLLLAAPFRELLFHGPLLPLEWAGKAAGQDDPFWLQAATLPPDKLDDARQVLARDWDVTDGQSLRRVVDWLLTAGHRTEIADVFATAHELAALNSARQDAALADMPKDVREAVRAALAARDAVGDVHGDAWDIARAAMLASHGLAVGLLDRDEAGSLLDACWAEAAGSFTGWDHYAASLMAGADVWMRLAEVRFAKFQRGWWRRTLDWLLADPRSPWVEHPWPKGLPAPWTPRPS